MAAAAELTEDEALKRCGVPGCGRVSKSRGLCEMHYARLRRTGDVGEASPRRNLPQDARFWAKVVKGPGDECWAWTCRRSAGGYGRFKVNGAEIMAHRYAYEASVGPIPDGLELDHLCRNRACVNPGHLEAVTSKINNERRAAVVTHCPQGHPYAGDNLYVRPDGRRRCRRCGVVANAKWRAGRHGL